MNKTGIRLSLTRMTRLIRIHLSDDWKSFLLVGPVFAGLAFFSGLVMGEPALGLLFKVSLLVGLVLVSRLFAGIRRREKGMYLFLLPASVEEKFIVQWLASLVGFYAYALLVVSLGSTAASLVNSVLYPSATFQVYFQPAAMSSFQTYFFFHSIFFTGALVFRRSNFIKTVLVLMAVSFFFILSSAVYLKNSLMQQSHSQLHLQFYGLDDILKYAEFPSVTGLYYAKIVVLIAIPVLLYAFSFYRFKNAEIKG